MSKRAIVIASWTLACLVAGTFSGCFSQPAEVESPPQSAGPPVVYVVNYPLQYFADRIGGDEIPVVFPAPPDVDPADWRPDDETVRAYQSADLILQNGAGYAKWTATVSLPDSKVVDTLAASSDRLIEIADGVVHQHGPGGAHSHRGTAFTTWLDPQLAQAQAQAIAAAFQQRFPENADQFESGWQRLKEDLQQLDDRLSEANENYRGQKLLASHPVYQYLARRCGWELKSLHWEPGEVPADDDWDELAAWLAAEPSAADWMIWEDEPLDETRERLARIGIRCVVFRPCANVPSDGDYLSVMQTNIDNLAAALAKANGS